MTWREDLRRVIVGGRQLVGASFRGVAFLVENSERGGGRRVVVHEFPLRNDPFAEDLGRKARTFRVDGYVIGDDYLTQKNALLDALESVDGPGELILPYYGGRAIRAVCTSLTVRESRPDGGIASFAIEFAETPVQEPVPVTEVAAAGRVAESADTAITASNTQLQERYHPEGLPAFALGSAMTALTTLTESMGTALAPVVKATQELARMTGQVRQITDTASALVRQPAAILGQFRDVIVGLIDTIASAPGDVMRALVTAYGSDPGPEVVNTTSTRATEHANQIALVGGLRQVLAIEAARLAPLVTYESIEAANEARNEVANLLEDQAITAGDTAYPALVNLRSEVLRAVPGNTTFARVITITLRSPLPSLVLAHSLYGSVDREPDIVARNHIRHPSFVTGTLKVLSDA